MSTLVLLAILLPAFLACTGDKKTGTETRESRSNQNVVADTTKAICPGCGMEMEKSEMLTYVAGGKTYYFCSEHCRQNFLASVDKDSVASPPAAP
jgi:YHS domain-containing protein